MGYSAGVALLRVNDPRGRTRLEALDGDRTVIGRSASCEIRIDDPEVGLRHISILRTERGYLIVNETDALPIWDGKSKVNNHFMIAGVAYRVGGSTLTLVTDDDDGDDDDEDHDGGDDDGDPADESTDIASAATMMAEQATPPATDAGDETSVPRTRRSLDCQAPPTRRRDPTLPARHRQRRQPRSRRA